MPNFIDFVPGRNSSIITNCANFEALIDESPKSKVQSLTSNV